MWQVAESCSVYWWFLMKIIIAGVYIIMLHDSFVSLCTLMREKCWRKGLHVYTYTIKNELYWLNHSFCTIHVSLICLLHGGVKSPTDKLIFKNNYGLHWFTRGQVLNILTTSQQLQQRQLSFPLLAWDRVCRYTCIMLSSLHVIFCITVTCYCCYICL